MTSRNRSIIALAIMGMLPCYAVEAKAGDAVFLEHDASHCEIFRAISPDVPEECRLAQEAGPGRNVKTRGIRVHGDDPALDTAGTNASGGAEAVAASETFSIAMQIQFEFDSTELTPESRTTLGQIAQVLQDDLMRDKVILLEGHADAAGAEGYNFDLSNRRAGSVRQFLMSTYGVAGERLQAVGRGELEPFDAANPSASINRRVEFTNLTD